MYRYCLFILANLGVLGTMWAQPETIPLRDVSAFKPTGPNWQIVGHAEADVDKDKHLAGEPGSGVLINLPGKEKGDNLFTDFDHGDLDIELEFMMAKGSNSGVYLQGRYEVQLRDSWGKAYPRFGDCGAIYQRYDEDRPGSDKGYEGVPPRVNACLAPGLWQKLFISFQAPRFSATGKKIQNARFLRVELNGVLLHENLEVSGPTRASAFDDEVPMGPLMLQGDHGPVAFRNIRYTRFEATRLAPTNMTYAVYEGAFTDLPDLRTLSPAQRGATPTLTQEMVQATEDFVLSLKGELTLPREGAYTLELMVRGMGELKLDGEPALPYGWNTQRKTLNLTEGTHTFEIIYHKPDGWYPNSLGLMVSGPGIRRQPLHNLSSLPLQNPVNPIRLEPAGRVRMLRSFVDFQAHPEASSRRITHAINVGFPSGGSFTYDADRAALVQVWQGGFLNTTPMWRSRGNGSSRPEGRVLPLGDEPSLALLVQDEAAWPEAMPDAVGYRFKGYEVAPDGVPTFLYQLGTTTVQDRITVSEARKAFHRLLTIGKGLTGNWHCRLGNGHEILEQANNLYSVDQRYFVRIQGKGAKPFVRTTAEGAELLLPVKSDTQIEYEILW